MKRLILSKETLAFLALHGGIFSAPPEPNSSVVGAPKCETLSNYCTTYTFEYPMSKCDPTGCSCAGGC